MHLASIRLVTSNAPRLAAFYEQVTGVAAQWATDTFAEVVTPTATVAIADVSTLAVFGADLADPAANRSVIVEFQVDDVDADHQRLAAAGLTFLQEPTTMPWGNRSALLRDPDGSLVNLYTPTSAQAQERFAGRSPSA